MTPRRDMQTLSGGKDLLETRTGPEGPVSISLATRLRRLDIELLAPTRIELVGVARERFERTREFPVLFRELDRVGPGLPTFVRLTQRNRAGRRTIDVAIRTAAGSVDQIAVTEVLEEAG